MDGEPTGEGFDYPRMVREALRGVVRQALARVAEEGLPDEHHFFIAFKTDAPGVRVPRFLRDLHPDEMTIVLQHQFWDLEVDDVAFSVTLTFGGSQHRLTVPYDAVVTFADPAASFGLRFDAPPAGAPGAGAEGESAGEKEAPGAEETSGADVEPAEPAPSGPAKVVRLDRFRSKHDDG